MSISDNFGSTFAILQREREKTETFCDFFEVHPVEPQIKLSFPPPEFSPLNLYSPIYHVFFFAVIMNILNIFNSLHWYLVFIAFVLYLYFTSSSLFIHSFREVPPACYRKLAFFLQSLYLKKNILADFSLKALYLDDVPP